MQGEHSMRTWIKNGARMTILVTAFAGAGAGLAYSQMSAGTSLATGHGAGHAVVHLISMHSSQGEYASDPNAINSAAVKSEDGSTDGSAGTDYSNNPNAVN